MIPILVIIVSFRADVASCAYELAKGLNVDAWELYEGIGRITGLMIGAMKGNIEIIKTLLIHKASAEHKDSRGFTALTHALTAKQQNCDIIGLLLQCTANKPASDINSALRNAARDGHADIVATLIQYTDSQAKDRALHSAVAMGHFAVVRALILEGAEVNYQVNYHGLDQVSGLMIAVMKDHTAVVQTLLFHGVNTQHRDRRGYKALQYALNATHLNSTIIAELLTYEQCPCYQPGFDMALIRATSTGDFFLVETLLDYGAPENTKNGLGNTVLMLASKRGHTNVARVLLEHKAMPDLQNEDGLTALMMAAKNEEEMIVRLLLIHNADTQLKDKNGYTALWFAKTRGNAEIVNQLKETMLLGLRPF